MQHDPSQCLPDFHFSDQCQMRKIMPRSTTTGDAACYYHLPNATRQSRSCGSGRVLHNDRDAQPSDA
jgi:hypothetical protein